MRVITSAKINNFDTILITMKRFERGSITLGASLLGAVLIAVPMLAKNMLATPTGTQTDPSSGSTGLTPIQLESQNSALRDEIKALKTELTKYKLTAVFTRATLKMGDKGDDVRGLQLFLSAIPDVYPENSQSGIYGPSTEKAVRTFQDREGLAVNGKVDEKTMAKVFDLIVSSEVEQENSRIDAVLASATPKILSVDKDTNTDSAPITNPTNTGNVPIIDTGFTDGISSYLSQIGDFLNIDLTPTNLNNTLVTPPIGSPTIVAVTGAQCGGAIDLSWGATTNATAYQVIRDGSQVVQTTNLFFSDTEMPGGSSHSYTVIATDGVSLSSPSNTATAVTSSPCATGSTTTQTATVVAPVISNISVSNIQSNAAKINWSTDIIATSQVEYGKTTSYGTKTTTDINLVTNHTVSLSNLTTKTTYHYRVISTANSTTTNSVDKTFTTN